MTILNKWPNVANYCGSWPSMGLCVTVSPDIAEYERMYACALEYGQVWLSKAWYGTATHRYDQMCLRMVIYGSVCPVMAEYNRIWHSMAKYVSVSSSMVVYSRIRLSIDGYRPVWLIMTYYDPIWPTMSKYDRTWHGIARYILLCPSMSSIAEYISVYPSIGQYWVCSGTGKYNLEWPGI